MKRKSTSSKDTWPRKCMKLGKSLLESHPTVAAQWHATLNDRNGQSYLFIIKIQNATCAYQSINQFCVPILSCMFATRTDEISILSSKWMKSSTLNRYSLAPSKITTSIKHWTEQRIWIS